MGEVPPLVVLPIAIASVVLCVLGMLLFQRRALMGRIVVGLGKA